MKLSILISVFNGQDYIAQCLNGVLAQNLTPSDYEVLLMDDGSNDASYELAMEFANKHEQIKVFTQENRGLYNTRNTLLSLAQGEYIYNLDIDDALVENRLYRILDLGISEKLDFVGFKSRESANIKPNDLRRDDIEKYQLYENGQVFIINNQRHRFEVWWYLIRRSFLEEKKIIFEDNQNNADVLFTFQVLLSVGKMAYFDWVSHYYYQSPDSIMRSNNFNKNLKLVNTMHEMILSNSLFLNGEIASKARPEVLRTIKQRLTQLAFINLVTMVRIGLKFNVIRQKIQELKSEGIYPLDMASFQSFSIKMKVLAFFANSQFLLRIGTMLMQFKNRR